MLSKVIVNSPWYFFLLSFAIGSLFALTLYFRNAKNTDLSKRVLLILGITRFLSTSVICFLLLSILFRHIRTETEKPAILLAIDNSSSIVSNADSSTVRSNAVQAIKALKDDLAKDYDVKTLLFGSQTNLSDATPDFNEKETDLENLVRDVDNNYSNQNIGALVLFSDGIFNKGGSPLNIAEKFGYPVFTVAMGDTSEIKDVLVAKINHNQVAYLGNSFPVEVVIQSKKISNQDVTISILENGVEKTKQVTKITSGNFTGTSNFTLQATSPGIVKYTVRVSQPEGDKNPSNNIRDFIIEVIDNKEKVLLLAARPHPDISAVKDALLDNTSYELSYGFIEEFHGNLKAYSLVMIHGYSAANAAMIAECQKNTIPYWIINPSSPDNIPGLKITGGLNRYNDAEPVLDNAFGLFSLSPELKKFTNDLPAVKTFFGNYSNGNGANTLLNQKIGNIETDNPIFYFTELNGLKSAVFAGDGLWKWKLRDYAEHTNHNLFNELIGKSVQYLAVKSDKSFFRVNAPRIINENMRVELEAEVYNKSYELITDPDVSLILKNEDNKTFNYTFSKTSNAYRLDLGMLSPGEYQYEAKVKSNNDLFVKKGRFVVKEVVSEKLNTVANHQLLYQLANRTEGKLVYLSQMQELKQSLLKNENIKPITYAQTTVSSLIDLKWLFWLILVIMGLEWFLRKRFLSI